MTDRDDLLMGLEPLNTRIKSVRATPGGRSSWPGRKQPIKVAAPTPKESAVENAIRSRLILFGIVMQKNSNEAMSAILGYGRQIPGTTLGWPDQAVYGPGRRHALFEVKVPGWKPSGKVQRAHWEQQCACHDLLRGMGHLVAVVHDQDEACAVLKADGWPIR